MNSRERRREVLHDLQQNKRVYVTELAQKFDVTTMTIRRDLKRLAEANIVTLVHGGATYNEGTAAFPSLAARERIMSSTKDTIGAYCAAMVQEGNAIFLDTGTSIMRIAGALAGRKNIAVLTNSLAVMNILSANPAIQLFSMPGKYDVVTKGFFGDLTCRAIRGFRIDMAFMGLSGLSLEGGLMTTTADDQAIMRTLLETARQKIVVADHSKIGHESLFKVGDLGDVQKIITDKHAEKSFVEGAGRKGVEVVQLNTM